MNLSKKGTIIIEEPFISHCDVGNHDVTNAYTVICHICKRKMCVVHQGNKGTLAGNWVACPLHVEEVETMNQQHWERCIQNRH